MATYRLVEVDEKTRALTIRFLSIQKLWACIFIKISWRRWWQGAISRTARHPEVHRPRKVHDLFRHWPRGSDVSGPKKRSVHTVGISLHIWPELLCLPVTPQRCLHCDSWVHLPSELSLLCFVQCAPHRGEEKIRHYHHTQWSVEMWLLFRERRALNLWRLSSTWLAQWSFAHL